MGTWADGPQVPAHGEGEEANTVASTAWWAKCTAMVTLSKRGPAHTEEYSKQNPL